VGPLRFNMLRRGLGGDGAKDHQGGTGQRRSNGRKPCQPARSASPAWRPVRAPFHRFSVSSRASAISV